MDPYSQINQLWQENKRLTEENQTLKQSLEELIAVNTELTQSIEEYSSNNGLEAQVQQLQTENKNLKHQLNNTLKQMDQLQQEKNNSKNQQSKEHEEMAEVIQQLIQSSKTSQAAYEQQLEKLTGELNGQKNYWENLLRDMENNYATKVNQYEATISNLKARNETLNSNMELKMLKQSQNIQNEERKNLKVSATIEDLRIVLEKQIEEKQKVIKIYEGLITRLKEKLKQKY